MGKPLRVLFVEDSEDDVKLLVIELRKGGYDPFYKRVQTPDDLRSSLAAGEWEFLVSDFRMPGFSGMDALAILKESGLDLPFLIVSGTIGEVNAVELMKAGAHDYIMKDNLTRLVPAIGRELQDAEDRRSSRHAQAALRESEERFRTMADSAPVLLWVTEANSACNYVNKPWLEFTGRSLEEQQGSGWRASMHSEDAPAVAESYRQNSVLQRGFQTEYRLCRHDGQWRWMLETATPRFHSDGAFAGYIGSVVDLTERKQAEIERESIRAENERLMAEKAANMVAQREFLKDILYSVTEGKLILCDSRLNLPRAVAATGDPIPLTSASLRDLRQSCRTAGHALNLAQERCDDLVTAVSEASMNAVVHGGGGQARVCFDQDKLQVWIEDQGQGIDIKELPRATLERGYTTGSSFGHGFYMMLSLVDRIYLLTGAGGTCIVLEQFLVSPEPIWLQGLPQESVA